MPPISLVRLVFEYGEGEWPLTAEAWRQIHARHVEQMQQKLAHAAALADIPEAHRISKPNQSPKPQPKIL